MFDRRVPFYKTMARIEARCWNSSKETFDDYVIDKMTLMQQLDLPVPDVINLLVGGISQPMLRATALSLRSDTVEQFLEAMRHITSGMADDDRKRLVPEANEKRPTLACRNCGKKGHNHQLSSIISREQLICFYCKVPGHCQYDCPNKKPGGTTSVRMQPKSSAVAAAVTRTEETEPAVEDAAAEVAAVREPETTLEIASPLIRISSLCKRNCNLVALVDTSSPVSFVKDTVHTRHKGSEFELKPSLRNLRNLCDRPLNIKGTVRVTLLMFCAELCSTSIYL